MIKNKSGSLSLVAIIVVVMTILIFTIFGIINNSRSQMDLAVHYQAKKALIDKELSLIRSEYLVNYSLSKYNSPATNEALKACLLSATVGSNCGNVNIDFYSPGVNKDDKFAGSQVSPAYLDYQGNSCVDSNGQPTNLCKFKIISACNFTCPGNQQVCPLDKIMSCGLQISSYETSFFKTFLFSDSNKVAATSYAIHLSNDLSSVYVVGF